LRADILARDQEMLIKSHVRSLSSAAERQGADRPRYRFGSTNPRDITLPKKGCPATAAVRSYRGKPL